MNNLYNLLLLFFVLFYQQVTLIAETISVENFIDQSLEIKNINLEQKNHEKIYTKIVSSLIKDLENFKNNDAKSKKNFDCNNSLIVSLDNIIKSIPRGQMDEAYYLKGISYEICGNLKNAESSYQKSLELRRNNSDAIFRLISIFLSQNKFKEVESLIQEAQWNNFKEIYLLKFASGIVKFKGNDYVNALNLFSESLNNKPSFLPAAYAVYYARQKLRSTLKNSQEIQKIDNQVPQDLAIINRLDENNYDIAYKYMRYLLETGNPINSPQKLKEGLIIADKWILKNTKNKFDVALLKVQFLEKANKHNAVLTFLLDFEKTNKLNAPLIAKKAALEQHSPTISAE